MNSWHGILLKECEKFWSNVRIFAYYNRTIFEFLFLGIYTLEQIILIWLTFHARKLAELNYIISIFAVIVLTTFAIHKIVMESRIKYLENELVKLSQEKTNLETTFRYIDEKKEKIIETISQDLYSLKK